MIYRLPGTGGSDVTRIPKNGVLPLIALLVFLNGAVCYCLDFGHAHDHGGAYEHESDEPAPHDCQCTVIADFVQAQDAPVDIHGLASLVAPATEPVGRSEGGGQRRLADVRPPGEHEPPRFVLHCALIC